MPADDDDAASAASDLPADSPPDVPAERARRLADIDDLRDPAVADH